MGLARAIAGAVGGVLGDQWREYFYCPAIPSDMLLVEGRKRSSRRGSNDSGSDNVVSAGSVIAVADGQCMIVVEQGRVVEVCAEPGSFVFDASAERSVFAGDLGEGLAASAGSAVRRAAFGGEPAMDHRLYYVNTRELVGNKYGTASPVPFKVSDPDTGLTLTMNVKCFGEYSYRVVDPVLLYTNVIGNAEGGFKRSELDGQLRSELLSALQPAFARLSAQRIEYDQVPACTDELVQAVNDVLSDRWRDLRGIEVVSMAMSSIVADEEDEEMLKQVQLAAALGGGNLAVGYSVAAAGEAVRDAAANDAGAAAALLGVGAAGMLGASVVDSAAAASRPAPPAAPAAAPVAGPAATAVSLAPGSSAGPAAFPRCASCGWAAPAGVSASFCPECGKPLG